MKVGELIRLLAENGWRLVRTRGSHRQYRNPSKGGTVTVAGKPSLDVPPGTLSAILKQAVSRRGSSGFGVAEITGCSGPGSDSTGANCGSEWFSP